MNEDYRRIFHLSRPAEVITDVGNQVDLIGLKYARRSKIRTGVAQNVNGKRKGGQLNGHIQVVTTTHWEHFNIDLAIRGLARQSLPQMRKSISRVVFSTDILMERPDLTLFTMFVKHF